MSKGLKVTDATKEELIQYFFGVEGLGGGYRIAADKERFLIWLSNKRSNALLTAGENASEAAQKALHEYIGYVRQMNATENFDEKIRLIDKANKAYERYEKFNRQSAEAYEKADKVWG